MVWLLLLGGFPLFYALYKALQRYYESKEEDELRPADGIIDPGVRDAYVQKIWNDLKQRFYCEDGSLRDIYVMDTSVDDWRVFAECVNKNYPVTFFGGDMQAAKEEIDINAVERQWNKEIENGFTATIEVGNTKVNTFFFTDTQIEQDIDPKELKSLEDHLSLVAYMQHLAAALHKDVLLTEENTPTSICFKVGSNEFEYDEE